MVTVCVRLSQTSGNPEVWAFEEQSSVCKLVYGSLVTGGLTNTDKQAGYGNSMVLKKLKSGYSLVTQTASIQDISDAKQSIFASISQTKLGVEAFKIYCEAMQIWNRKPNLSLQKSPVSLVQPVTSANAATQAEKPVRTTKSFDENAFTSKCEIGDSWNW